MLGFKVLVELLRFQNLSLKLLRYDLSGFVVMRNNCELALEAL